MVITEGLLDVHATETPFIELEERVTSCVTDAALSVPAYVTFTRLLTVSSERTSFVGD